MAEFVKEKERVRFVARKRREADTNAIQAVDQLHPFQVSPGIFVNTCGHDENINLSF